MTSDNDTSDDAPTAKATECSTDDDTNHNSNEKEEVETNKIDSDDNDDDNDNTKNKDDNAITAEEKDDAIDEKEENQTKEEKVEEKVEEKDEKDELEKEEKDEKEKDENEEKEEKDEKEETEKDEESWKAFTALSIDEGLTIIDGSEKKEKVEEKTSDEEKAKEEEKTNDEEEKVQEDEKKELEKENETAATKADSAKSKSIEEEMFPPPSPPKEASKPYTPIVVPDATCPPTAKEKNTCYQHLRSYESRRREIYTNKLKSSSLYWQSFRELLSSSLEETERIERMIKGNLVAATGYAQICQGAVTDRLDSTGRVLDDHKARKVIEERRKKYDRLGGVARNYSSGGGITRFGDFLTSLTALNKTTTTTVIGGEDGISGGTALKSKKKSPRKALLVGSTLISSLLESQSVMANRFQENVTFVEETSLKEIIDIRSELEIEVYSVTLLGDAIVDELERAEQDVQDAWGNYFTMASKSLDTSTNDIPDSTKSIFNLNNSSTNTNSTTSTTTSTTSSSQQQQHQQHQQQIRDIWLVEMHYRMSVAYLTTTWEKSSSELSKIFASMKEMEVNRRFQLCELLTLYMQRQERLWLSIPAVVNPVLKDLSDRPTDAPTVEREVQTTIRARALDLGKEKDAVVEEQQQQGTTKSTGPGLATAEKLDPTYELQSPLMSELLLKADVIEKKSDSVMSKWKTTLVIATSDSFLHFFDMPSNAGVRPGTAPEVAFQALVPAVNVPTNEMLKNNNGKIIFGKSWFEYLIPGDSINLKNSAISLNENKGDSIFEIAETIEHASPVQKLFHKRIVRKFSIRLFSNHEMVSWLLALGMVDK